MRAGVDSAELIEQLRGEREDFRRERERRDAELDRRAKRVAKGEAQLREGERAVALEHKRIRAIYQRCLGRIKTRWAAERTSAANERAELEATQDRFRAFAERRRAELDRLAGQLGDDKSRLQSAWELLAEGQRRAIEDRREHDDWLARQRDALDLRAKMLIEQQKLHEANSARFHGQQPQLATEIAGLEARATHLRQIIAQLDEKRAAKLAAGERINGIALAPISLEPSRLPRGVSHQADNLLGELQAREQELAHERQAQANLRVVLESQAAELADQRAILAEQIGILTSARNLWHDAEAEAVAELHTLALDVRSGEQSLGERERELAAAERRRRSHDHALVELRFKLESWHVALAAKESSVLSEADRLDARQTAKRDQLDRWEAALGGTASSWAELRQQEIEFLRAELDRVAVDRAEQIAATAEARRIHAELHEQLIAVAARELANTGEKQGSTRRIRLLEKRWMSHFRREERRQAGVEERLQRDRAELEERTHRLQRETDRFLEKQLAETLVRTAHDRERLAVERRIREATEEAELETQLRFRSEDDARRLRGEIARMSQAILTANLSSPDEPDAVILPLKAAQAA